METKNFRTRQEFIDQSSPKGKSYIVALDAGYSSMKVFTENKHFCFPSYVKEINDDMLDVSSASDIKYQDGETKQVYMLGYSAQDMIESTSTSDTDGDLYGRKRYNNRNFQILCNAALGIALLEKQVDDEREIVIQTGLPTAYVEADKKPLVKSLCKPARFALKIGLNNWVEFNFVNEPSAEPKANEYVLKESNVLVMPQPAGSLYSVMIDKNGDYVANAKDYMFKNVLVLDIGFGTFDFYGSKNRSIVCKESLPEFGMREVLECTRRKIFDEMNEDIRIQAMQKNLEKGVVVCFDEEEMKSDERPIAEIVDSARREVFAKAFEKAKATTGAFRDYDMIIIAGGTGEAWFDLVQEYFSGMKSLKVIPSNANDDLPFLYSNVRGYYMFCYKSYS